MKIEPTNITNYNRSQAELEAFWIFCLSIQGKNSDIAARAVNRFISNLKKGYKVATTPFDMIRDELYFNENALGNALKVARIGQYTRLEKAIKGSLKFDLRTATVDELMTIHGVGPKTARFFILHTRQYAKHAVLDVHILRWMKQTSMVDVPDSTPTKESRYKELEAQFIDIAQLYFPNMTVAEIDLSIWATMSGRL